MSVDSKPENKPVFLPDSNLLETIRGSTIFDLTTPDSPSYQNASTNQFMVRENNSSTYLTNANHLNDTGKQIYRLCATMATSLPKFQGPFLFYPCNSGKNWTNKRNDAWNQGNGIFQLNALDNLQMHLYHDGLVDIYGPLMMIGLVDVSSFWILTYTGEICVVLGTLENL